jgi:hypothetical protein
LLAKGAPIDIYVLAKAEKKVKPVKVPKPVVSVPVNDEAVSVDDANGSTEG